MTYSEFIDVLKVYAESEYAKFHSSLTPTNYEILGIRVPIMRKLAKQYQCHLEDLLSFPNEYYEVVFIKLTVISNLPYEQFIQYVFNAIEWIDNWALCDCFRAKCIRKHKEEFLLVLEDIFQKGKEFYQRYVFVTLLCEYLDGGHLPIIEKYICRADTSPYYVHMAIAWLLAEMLAKYYEYGIILLQKIDLEPRTHNKAIQKAIESYRLNKNQKEYLRSLKIKTNKYKV